MTFHWRPVRIRQPETKPLEQFGRSGTSIKSTLEGQSGIVFPTREPHEIAQSLIEGKDVSLLEMNVLLASEHSWTFWDTKGHSLQIAAAIARKIERDQGLYNDCVWRVLYSKVEASYFFPKKLIACLFQLQKTDGSLFKAIYFDDYTTLIQSALNDKLTPSSLLSQFNLPLRSELFVETTQKAIDYYLKQSQRWQLQYEHWLIECLKALLNEQRHRSVNHLLSKMTKDTLTQLPQLQQQLYQWYPQRSTEFAALTSHSQQLLQLFDILRGWNIFELFTEKVFGYRVKDVQSLFGAQNLNDRMVQARHALSRMGIWSNYTSHIKDITFFVPMSFKSSLMQHTEFQMLDQKIFQYANIATPCLVFHIAHVTIVQYLWAPPKNMDKSYGHAIAYQQLSMLPTPHSVGSLRELYAVKCFQKEWQQNLYRFIRDDLRLQPNEGWTEFRGYPKNHIDPRTGLPK